MEKSVTNRDNFLDKLKEFETVLFKYGYIKAKVEGGPTKIHSENIATIYENIFIKQEMRITYLEGEGTSSVQFSMYKIPHAKTFFNLKDFLIKNNLLDKIRNRISNDEDFDQFIKEFFLALESLFENEMNDHITGKKFENYYDENMKKFWDDYR